MTMGRKKGRLLSLSLSLSICDFSRARLDLFFRSNRSSPWSEVQQLGERDTRLPKISGGKNALDCVGDDASRNETRACFPGEPKKRATHRAGAHSFSLCLSPPPRALRRGDMGFALWPLQGTRIFRTLSPIKTAPGAPLLIRSFVRVFGEKCSICIVVRDTNSTASANFLLLWDRKCSQSDHQRTFSLSFFSLSLSRCRMFCERKKLSFRNRRIVADAHRHVPVRRRRILHTQKEPVSSF